MVDKKDALTDIIHTPPPPTPSQSTPTSSTPPLKPNQVTTSSGDVVQLGGKPASTS
jgi:hypothetical protein